MIVIQGQTSGLQHLANHPATGKHGYMDETVKTLCGKYLVHPDNCHSLYYNRVVHECRKCGDKASFEAAIDESWAAEKANDAKIRAENEAASVRYHALIERRNNRLDWIVGALRNVYRDQYVIEVKQYPGGNEALIITQDGTFRIRIERHV